MNKQKVLGAHHTLLDGSLDENCETKRANSECWFIVTQVKKARTHRNIIARCKRSRTKREQ